MLTAQRENDQRKAKVFAQRSPTTRSFDRVINSIDGLRERVQGFSVEQLSEVEQSLHAMSMRLAELQETLRVISEIKEQLDLLRPEVERTEAEIMEQNSLATLDRSLPVHSIMQVSNLLKFQRVIKLLRKAKHVSGDLTTPDSHSGQPVPPKSAEIVPEALTKAYNAQAFATTSTEIEHALAEGSATEATVVAVSESRNCSQTPLHPVTRETDAHPVLATPDERGFESAMTGHEPTADLPETEYNQAEDPDSETPLVAVGETSVDSEQLLRDVLAQPDFEPNESSSNDSAESTLYDNYDNTASIDDQAMNPEFPDTSDRPGRAYAIPDTEAERLTIAPNRAGAPEVDFDQRLLDDLIKNYGEFNVLPNSATATEAGQDNVDQDKTARPRTNSVATLNAESLRDLPAQRKDGELDLKLKKLIKDYGEYDLYSRQSPINLKTGVAAAFLVLALALSGFYFFSSQRSVVPSNALSASQPEASGETASKEISTKDSTRVEETPPALSLSNGDVSKSVESEGSRNLPNKIAPKKTK